MTSPNFADFWVLYPKKMDRRCAERAWKKLSEEQRVKAVEAISTHVLYWKAVDTERQFIPFPATWLNGWRFDDEIEMPKPKPVAVHAWWTTESGTLEQGAKYGLTPRGGEDWNQFRSRIRDAIQGGSRAV